MTATPIPHRGATKIRESNPITVISVICITLFTLLCLFPFVLMITSSFMSEGEIITEGYKLLPKTWSLEAYKYVFTNPTQLINAYKVTIIITIVGTGLGLLLMTMTGFVLNVKSFRYRSAVAFFFYFTTLFSGGLVPTYLLYVKYLGLKDSILALIFPGMLSSWSIFLMRNFMKSIPDALYESASAIATVGLSAAGTANMCIPAQYLIVLYMYFGRVGVLTIALGFLEDRKTERFRYAETKLMIG